MAKKKRLSLSMDSDTLDRLRAAALKRHCSLSQYVTDLIWRDNERKRNYWKCGKVVIKRTTESEEI